MGYGYWPPQYGVSATRCTPPRVSQNGLHSSLNDPKQFLQGQAEFADSPTSSQGTRSRAYQQTVPCKRSWNILTDCDCGTDIIQYHDRVCRGWESNRTTPAVSQMNCIECTWKNYIKRQRNKKSMSVCFTLKLLIEFRLDVKPRVPATFGRSFSSQCA